MHSPRRPSRRVLVLSGVAVTCIVAGTTWWLTRSEPAAAQSATMTVTRTTFKETVSASGTIEPAKQADLSFAVAGTVTKVLVTEGQKVRKGDVLAIVDDSLLESEVTAKESALDAAETRLDDDEDADASDTQLASDRAAVVNAETQLALAKEALADAKLRSTINGTVASVEVAVGDSVGAEGGDGTTAQVTVVSAQRFVVDAQVGTGDIDGVKKGLQVEITPTGATEPIYGTVAAVGRVATAQDNGAATYPVTVDVTGRKKNVFAGTSATLEIIVKEVDDVLAVPSMALRTDDAGTYVYKMVDGKRVRTPVETGETYGAQTEVTSGLSEGDVVEVLAFDRVPGSGGQQGGGNSEMPAVPPGGMVFQDGGPTFEKAP